MSKGATKIAVNCRFLLPKLEGFGRFSHEMLSRLVKNNPEVEFLFLFDRPFEQQYVYADNVTPLVVNPPTRHPLLYLFWFECRLPAILKKEGVDLFLSPDGALSLRSRKKQISIIHDLNFEHHPEDLPWAYRWYYRKFFPKFARKADALLTVSNYSKQDLVQQYELDPDKITVVYNGVNDTFAPTSEQEGQEVRIQWTNGKPYFIYLGALHKRKNIGRLLEAFDVFKTKHAAEHQLILVGNAMFSDKDLEKTYASMKFKEDVIFTGFVEDTTLVQLLGAAEALVYVSYFEGFGIPVAEAMRCHTPVITSNTTSLPEVAGEAGLLADPFSVEDIARQMIKITEDPELKTALRTRAKEQVKRFNWDDSASLLWETIKKELP